MLRSFVKSVLFNAALVGAGAWLTNAAATADARPPRKLFRRKLNRQSKKMREKMPAKKVDKMIEDSFPASDPPSTY